MTAKRGDSTFYETINFDNQKRRKRPMQHTLAKFNEMTKHMRRLSIFLVPVVALILGAVAPAGWAQDEPPECFFNIELNATDRDVGVRGFFDYEPWKELEIEDPRGRTIAEVEAEKRMKRQGFAELFFESGEPELSELPFSVFFRRFREGDYEFEAEPIDGGEVECTAEFTHVIPCGPVVSVDVDTVEETVTIEWDEVEDVVDPVATDATGGTAIVCVTPDEPLEIEGYEVILEGEESEFNFKISDDVTELVLPLEIFEAGDYEFEVLAIEESGNQTITEGEFTVP
jgi:hypothetical protein